MTRERLQEARGLRGGGGEGDESEGEGGGGGRDGREESDSSAAAGRGVDRARGTLGAREAEVASAGVAGVAVERVFVRTGVDSCAEPEDLSSGGRGAVVRPVRVVRRTTGLSDDGSPALLDSETERSVDVVTPISSSLTENL